MIKSSEIFDVAIIGAGIVGLATAFQLKKKFPAFKIVVIEKENIISKHQTGNNSGVIHSGIYYKPGSEKAKNCSRGYDLLISFLKKYKLPYDICGKIIVATNKSEKKMIKVLMDRGIKNGLKNLKILSKNEIKLIEPNVEGVEAIYVPQAGITDYKLVSKKLYEILKLKGVKFFFNFKVSSIKKKNKLIFIGGKNLNQICSKRLINTAGLYSDKITELCELKIDHKIIPFRGEYYNLKPHAKHLVKNLIYPVPDPNFPFLGVHFTRTIHGEVETGPNAVFALSREGYNKNDINFKEFFESISYKGFLKIATKHWREGLKEFYRSYSKKSYLKSLQKMIPKVKINDISAGNSGVRAQAITKDGNLLDDFLILKNESIINVCNAPSPAATAAFAIGEHICKFVKK